MRACAPRNAHRGVGDGLIAAGGAGARAPVGRADGARADGARAGGGRAGRAHAGGTPGHAGGRRAGGAGRRRDGRTGAGRAAGEPRARRHREIHSPMSRWAALPGDAARRSPSGGPGDSPLSSIPSSVISRRHTSEGIGSHQAAVQPARRLAPPANSGSAVERRIGEGSRGGGLGAMPRGGGTERRCGPAGRSGAAGRRDGDRGGGTGTAAAGRGQARVEGAAPGRGPTRADDGHHRCADS